MRIIGTKQEIKYIQSLFDRNFTCPGCPYKQECVSDESECSCQDFIKARIELEEASE